MSLFTETPSFQQKVEAAFASVIAAGALRVSDQTPRPFVNDCRLIVLENDTLRLQVVRDRGHIEVEVLALPDGGAGFDLRVILGALTSERELLTRELGLDEQAALVTKHWTAFSDA